MAVSGRAEISVGEIAAAIKNALVGGPFGSDLGTADYVPTGVPVIRGQNLSLGKFVGGDFVFVSEEKADKLRANLARPGDLVFTQRGNAVLHGGQVAIVPDKPFDRYVVSQSQMKLTSDDTKVDPEYLYFVFTSAEYRHYLQSNAVVTGVPHINLGLLREYVLSLPPLSEQKAIAAVLGALDDKIELNRRMNATLESMARALFQSWFVDFDPVRAKLDGREPAGMTAETAELFPDRFHHSETGKIVPEGWVTTELGHEVDFQTGFAFPSEQFTEVPPGIRLARGMNVKEGEFFWGNQSRYWPEVTEDLTQYLLKVGDVLIGMDGSKVGKNWVRVRSSDLPCLLVQRVARLRELNSIGQNFIALLIGSTTFRDFVDAVKTGTSIPHISGGQIKGYSFVRPPIGDDRLFHAFEALVGPMTAQADKNHAEAEILTALRDTLLPKLLSGELGVVGAQNIVERVS